MLVQYETTPQQRVGVVTPPPYLKYNKVAGLVLVPKEGTRRGNRTGLALYLSLNGYETPGPPIRGSNHPRGPYAKLVRHRLG